MSDQLSLLGHSQPHLDQSYKAEEKIYKARSLRAAAVGGSAAKRLSSPAIQKVDLSSISQLVQLTQLEAQQPEVQTASTPWGLCRVYGLPIATPGNDASLCSNPARTCGSSGWVTNLNWIARSNQQGVSHE